MIKLDDAFEAAYNSIRPPVHLLIHINPVYCLSLDGTGTSAFFGPKASQFAEDGGLLSCFNLRRSRPDLGEWALFVQRIF